MSTPPKREKYAAPPPRRSGAPAKAPSPVANEAPKGEVKMDRSVPHRGQAPAKPATQTSVSDPSFPAVKEMQQAILDLAATMSNNYLMKIDMTHKERGGSDPFGNFLTNQYINNADIVGKQFVNVDLAEPLRSGTAMENKSLRGVISTLGRVGIPGTERKSDGIWKTRTHNALKQAVAIAAALLQLQKDMGITVEGYTDKDLAELAENVPENFTLVKDKAVTATKLTPNIRKLTEFYKAFEKQILNNDKHKAFITQQKPFTKHEKEDLLTKEEGDVVSQYGNDPLPGVNLGGHKVTLKDLNSLAAFKEFLIKANLIRPEDNVSLAKYVKQVKQLIENPVGY